MSSAINLLPTSDIDQNSKHPAGSFSAWLADTQQARSADVPCGACNACCRSAYFIHIRPEEKDTLQHIPAALLVAAPGLPRGNVIMGYNEENTCPMLEDGKCSIYTHRPQTCRDYDCRIFAATGIAAGGSEKTDVNHRAAHWQFEYSCQQDHLDHAAVHRAIKFLRDNAELFEPEELPDNPTQIALLAINVTHLFPLDQSMPDIKISNAIRKIVNRAR